MEGLSHCDMCGASEVAAILDGTSRELTPMAKAWDDMGPVCPACILAALKAVCDAHDAGYADEAVDEAVELIEKIEAARPAQAGANEKE